MSDVGAQLSREPRAGPGQIWMPAEHRDAERLVTLARECRACGITRRVLLLRLSALPEYCSRPHYVQLAREALDPLTAGDHANLYHLPNADLAVAWRGQAVLALQESLNAVRQLLGENAGQPPSRGSLALMLELPSQADTLLLTVAEALRRQHPIVASAARPTMPLDSAALRSLESALARASVDRFVRRKPVSALGADGGFRMRWEKRYLSVAELFEALLPDRAPDADPWLFLRLTRALDRRMLALLATTAELHQAGPFSLDLNVASTLSAEFLKFDAALPARLRGHVVLNLRAEDILADPAAYLFARDFARARGYRLLLRRVTAERLAMFPRQRTGVDLIELRWSRALATANLDASQFDSGTFVLSGADTTEAIAWGRSLGITFYQGKLAAPSRASVATGMNRTVALWRALGVAAARA